MVQDLQAPLVCQAQQQIQVPQDPLVNLALQVDQQVQLVLQAQ
jgi:hypothetical protein